MADLARLHRRRPAGIGLAARPALPRPLRGERAGDWDLAYAYEAIARAYKTAGRLSEADEYAKLAAQTPIAEDDDLEHLEQDLATL